MTILEQAMLFAVVCAALIGMSIWLKRAVMGKFQEVGQKIGAGRQY
jgi:Flp pilus assembly pilin Flp